MTRQPYEIYYESRELARELGDPLLSTVETVSPEEAVSIAERDHEIARRAMPCCGIWSVRVKLPAKASDCER